MFTVKRLFYTVSSFIVSFILFRKTFKSGQTIVDVLRPKFILPFDLKHKHRKTCLTQ